MLARQLAYITYVRGSMSTLQILLFLGFYCLWIPTLYREEPKKYGICLSEDEKEAFQAQSNEVSDEELDAAAGGCCSGGQYSCTSTECSDNHIT